MTLSDYVQPCRRNIWSDYKTIFCDDCAKKHYVLAKPAPQVRHPDAAPTQVHHGSATCAVCKFKNDFVDPATVPSPYICRGCK